MRLFLEVLERHWWCLGREACCERMGVGVGTLYRSGSRRLAGRV